ncbi:hypothetical protein FBU30_009696 [Linnemannia zychae]|nr:hypothetical protein FBU30_009696 [Linnemannia zychae]
MLFTRNQRLFQTLAISLSHERTQASGIIPITAYNLFRNALPASVVVRRLFTPSITRTFQGHISIQNTTSAHNYPIISVAEDISTDSVGNDTKHDKQNRKKYHSFGMKRPRWSKKEDELLLKYVRRGLSSHNIHSHFPGRTICSIDVRMSQLRSHEMRAGNIPKRPQISIKDSAWSSAEDEWLTKRLRDYLKHGGDPSDISWPKVANGMVDGERLGRTATSCKRRWAIIDPSSKRQSGAWAQDESDRLRDAIRSQLKELNIPTGESVAKGLHLNKLGLPLNGDILSKINWDEAAAKVMTRSDIQCRSHTFKHFESGKSGKWSDAEVKQLEIGLSKYGTDWNKLASIVGTRSAYQVRQKYLTTWRKRFVNID